ncbi:hypothetical protein ALI22I_10860 [Saccharothrix sp. ALI-22-I]|uniref:TetR/AcrR family transcriptional regulator n=1 Tax=Saccharothrix sp. ALI-22-I TaxID=1933778 RepID=UPI00097C4C04|nr:helix-turn-helix domain-containing protein [Saccharothrix sp. ALI-22-I]ONI90927.1 hypothetical protein ALI22I_10860 [Saccharothrix sp. ALI-22-I]
MSREGRRRADAERGIETILDAALDCLSEQPDVSMTAIAQAAGVSRVTLYTHFPSRENLLGQVLDRAVSNAAVVLDAEALDEGAAGKLKQRDAADVLEATVLGALTSPATVGR